VQGSRAPTALPLDFQLADDVVRLRALTAADARTVYRACVDAEIARFTLSHQPAHQGETRAWIEAEQTRREHATGVNFGIVPVGGAVVIGAIGLSSIDLDDRRARVDYWIAASARRRGFAAAALRLISRWALGPPLDLVRLELQIDVEDTASVRTAERAGYARDAVLRSYLNARGRRWDIALHSLVADDPDREAP
jgi:[ribosomal protein S5]-alanine N-acetyltransferase